MLLDKDHHYVLATGEKGEDRLRMLHAVHGADTENLLVRAGITEGMKVADVGCGIGTVSCWIAKRVGPKGKVVGVDINKEQVELARKNAEIAQLTNITFVEGGAYRTGLPYESFDLVFCRFVLMHLDQPMLALREIGALVKPGGLLVCEDGDFQSPFCEPHLKAFDRCFELYRAIGVNRGYDFEIGPKLYRMFLEAGFSTAEATLAQPVFVRGAAKRLPEWTLTECAPNIIKAGLATQKEITQLVAELTAFAEDPTTLIGMARVTQIWARK